MKRMHSLPLTGTTKRGRGLMTLVVVAIDLAGCVLGRIARASHRQSRTSPFHEVGGELIGHLRSGRERFLSCDENRCRSAGTFASWTRVIRTVTHIAVTTPPSIAMRRVPRNRNDAQKLKIQATFSSVASELRKKRKKDQLRKDGR